MHVLVIILSSVLCSSMAQVMLKLGATRAGVTSGPSHVAFLLHAAVNPFVILGTSLHVVALALWLLALREADVSYAYPFISLGFVVVLALSALWLHEPVGLLRVAGVVLIVGGIVLVGRS